MLTLMVLNVLIFTKLAKVRGKQREMAGTDDSANTDKDKQQKQVFNFLIFEIRSMLFLFLQLSTHVVILRRGLTICLHMEHKVVSVKRNLVKSLLNKYVTLYKTYLDKGLRAYSVQMI